MRENKIVNYFKTNEKFSNILLISLFLIIILIGIILLALGTTNEYETNSPSIEEICFKYRWKVSNCPRRRMCRT